MKRLLGIATAGLVFLVVPTFAQTTLSSQSLSPGGVAKRWTLAASIYAFFFSDEPNYLMPTLTADKQWLHLEARYNYEDLKTGALFIGWNFNAGDKLSFDATPILGAIFGDTRGIAPGLELSLSYGRVELYSEGEYVFDVYDSSESFFYNWSEFTYAPMNWLRVGIVTQRTKVNQKKIHIQEGLLIGVSFDQFIFTLHVFNLGRATPTLVFSVKFDF